LCGGTADSRIFAESNLSAGEAVALSWSSRKTPEFKHHRLLECRACDVVYASPLPPAASIADAYASAPFESGEESARAARTYGGLVDLVARGLPDREGAFDIGTGDGAFLAELLARGFTRVAGIEPSRAPRETAAAGVRELIRDGFFTGGEFPPGSMRLVTCFMTLEHLPDPLAACRAVRAILKEGGAFLVAAHDRRALPSRVLGRWSPIRDIEHLQLFSPASLATLLRRAGFADGRVWKFTNRYPLRYWIRLLPLPARAKRAFLGIADGAGLGRIPVSLPAGNIAAAGFNPSGGEG
jgi:SAM-dependent methyltransferase